MWDRQDWETDDCCCVDPEHSITTHSHTHVHRCHWTANAHAGIQTRCIAPCKPPHILVENTLLHPRCFDACHLSIASMTLVTALQLLLPSRHCISGTAESAASSNGVPPKGAREIAEHVSRQMSLTSQVLDVAATSLSYLFVPCHPCGCLIAFGLFSNLTPAHVWDVA